MYNDDRRLHHDAAPDERVTSLLEAASAPTEPGPVLGELEALAAFRATHGPASRRFSVSARLASARVTVGAALGALVLTGGVGAAAAAGSLPGAAQDTASEWLSKVGVTVPAAGDRPKPHDDRSDDSGEAEAPAGATHDGRGEDVSGTARDTEEAGADKGAAISELASHGRSRAGERGGSHGHADKGHDRDGHKGRQGEHRGDDEERRSEGEDSGDDVWGTDEVRDGDADSTTRHTDPDEDHEASATEKTDEARESYGSADSESRP
ncbi:MAG TPA: hypothetical protein VFJ83_04965 [Nocardioidaceae bacterium]|nr:hypothetical protein [Nocardioidaceae bacterium]